jgi:hypothetical protein
MKVTGPGTRVALQALLAAALVHGPVALATDWITVKPGLWSFERTMQGANGKPEKVETTECVDPGLDQKKQVEMLTKAGCKFEPIVQSGNTWRRRSTCKIGTMTSTTESVTTVTGPDAYTVTVDGVTNGQKTHEVLRARRLGNCPK